MLEELNNKQKEAVLAPAGPLLIIAGAGSGKTKVLVHRIARLITEGAPPEEILAVTFTNKAAKEMQERVTQILKQGVRNSQPWVGTFHALGAYILRHHGAAIGIQKNFTIVDEDDALSVVKRLLKEFRFDPKQYQPARMRHIISHIKNYPPAEGEEQPYPREIFQLYEAYEKELAKSASLDFDDLLVKTVKLLKGEKEIAHHYQGRWAHVLIDEYQDTNAVQYALSKILAGMHNNITVVGDVDQAIYSWRGADFRNLLAFEHDWPHARVITLEQNYRSTKTILDAANTVIEKNVERKEKTLWTKNTSGPCIHGSIADDEKEEALFVARRVAALQKTIPLRDMAILYRTNAQSRAVEEAFIKAGIPYRLVGGVRFYERREVKDMLAYLRLAVNPEDTISMRRIINVPPRGIGKTLQEKYFAGEILPPERIAALQHTLESIQRAKRAEPPASLIKTIIKKTGYETYLRDGTTEGEDRWANVRELVSVAAAYDHLPPPTGAEQFLEDVALIADADFVDRTKDAVHVMTVHAAKGLEFEAVFVIGLEEGMFPHSLSMAEPRELEEERRLCYVALTRAKKHLYLTAARTRMIFGDKLWNEPSRFLRDIPEHLFEKPLKFDELEVIEYD